jgi:hypothetical protein
MPKPKHQLPPLPEIGHPESFYAREVQQAERRGDPHAREALKVGQYVTLAMDPALNWSQKLRYFQHALRRHCNPPPLPDEEVWLFYRSLAHLVREYAGREALRLASAEDDAYARWMGLGGSRERICQQARQFFGEIMGDGDRCPDHFTEDDWAQLRLLRNQWV